MTFPSGKSLALTLFGFLLLSACPGAERNCTPGRVEACPCLGGLVGVQECALDGETFGVCVCERRVDAGADGGQQSLDGGATMGHVDGGPGAIVDAGRWMLDGVEEYVDVSDCIRVQELQVRGSKLVFLCPHLPIGSDSVELIGVSISGLSQTQGVSPSDPSRARILYDSTKIVNKSCVDQFGTHPYADYRFPSLLSRATTQVDDLWYRVDKRTIGASPQGCYGNGPISGELVRLRPGEPIASTVVGASASLYLQTSTRVVAFEGGLDRSVPFSPSRAYQVPLDAGYLGANISPGSYLRSLDFPLALVDGDVEGSRYCLSGARDLRDGGYEFEVRCFDSTTDQLISQWPIGRSVNWPVGLNVSDTSVQFQALVDGGAVLFRAPLDAGSPVQISTLPAAGGTSVVESRGVVYWAQPYSGTASSIFAWSETRGARVVRENVLLRSPLAVSAHHLYWVERVAGIGDTTPGGSVNSLRRAAVLTE